MIRTFADLEPLPLPDLIWPDDPQHQPPRPWWATLDATATRFDVICPGTQHRVGLVESPTGHLVYRQHFFATYGGRLWCPRSLREVCDPNVVPPTRAEVRCRHQLEAARA